MNLQTYVLSLLAPLKRRIGSMVFRAAINLVADAANVQTVQVRARADETHEGVERFQNYGHTSNPPANSQVILLCVGGNTDHPIAIMAEEGGARKAVNTRCQAGAGDSILYSLGLNFIKMGADGKVYIDAPENIFIRSAGTLRLEADTIEIKADTMFKVDVSGRGYNYFPTHTDSYEIGTLTVPISEPVPPEHPPAPSEIPLY